MQQRADTIETRMDSEKQQFGEIEGSIDALVATQQSQVELYQKTQHAVDERYQTISDQITALETKLVDINTSLEQFGTSIGAVEEKSQELEARLFSDDEPINQLRRDIQLLKAMELLTSQPSLHVPGQFGTRRRRYPICTRPIGKFACT